MGTLMAFQLAALGVATGSAGRLRLIDGDMLWLQNLMPGLTVADVGRPKVEGLSRRLHAYRPDMALTYIAKPVLDPESFGLLDRRSDLLISCVDNDTARLAVSLAARRTLTVHLDVSSSIQRQHDGSTSISADIRLLLPGEGCVSCVGGLDDPDRRLYDLAAPAGVLQRGRSVAWHEQRAGSLVTINSIAVGTALQTWLELCGAQITSSYWHRLAWQHGTGIESDSGPVSAGDDCPYCRRID